MHAAKWRDPIASSLTIGLGVAAVVSTAAVGRAVVLDPLPVENEERVVAVSLVDVKRERYYLSGHVASPQGLGPRARSVLRCIRSRCHRQAPQLRLVQCGSGSGPIVWNLARGVAGAAAVGFGCGCWIGSAVVTAARRQFFGISPADHTVFVLALGVIVSVICSQWRFRFDAP